MTAKFLPAVKGSREPLHHQNSPRQTLSLSGTIEQPSSGNTVASLLTHQLGELSRTLVFADDALAAHCSVPAPCSYAAAHQSSKQLFAHQTIGIPIRCRVSKVGRHNSRGSGSKHLPCHLTQSLPCGIPEEGTDQLSRMNNQVPRTLTAYQREKSPNEIYPPQEEHSSDKKKPSASSGRIGSVAGPKTFTEQMASGAKPLHLVHGRDSTILLDNNALFKKVVQSRYPPPPSKFHQTNRGTKKTAASEITSDRPLAFLQGHKRWLDFPRPIEVSLSIQLLCNK